MSKECKQCLNFEYCNAYEVCENYASLENDSDIDELIELRRTEFYKEWFQYIEKYN